MGRQVDGTRDALQEAGKLVARFVHRYPVY